MASEDQAAVESFLQAWASGSRRAQERLRSRVPIPEMKKAALVHADPRVRGGCLFFLDHYAADESVSIFVSALSDPVPAVRGVALHGLACEQCRTEELCVADVTPKLVDVLTAEPNPEVRYKTLVILQRLAGRDLAAVEAMRAAAEHDQDRRVRAAAASLLAGNRPRSWNRFRRSLDTRKAKALRRGAHPAHLSTQP